MTPALPCPECGAVDNLEEITPLGVHMDKAVLWLCTVCGTSRAVLIDYRLPADLVRRALLRDEMRPRINRYLQRSATA